jgi:hypothetical protein
VIYIVGDQKDRETTEIVARAFERSFSRSQVRELGSLNVAARNAIVVVINPDEDAAEALSGLLKKGGKVILLGSLGPAMSGIAGADVVPIDAELAPMAHSDAAPAGEMRGSRAVLHYSDSGLGQVSPLRRRYFCRYDFLNEWNNLGYGRIGFGGDRWSIAQVAESFDTPVAMVEIDGMSSIGAAVTIRDLPQGSVLWIARPVGVVDGQDWAVVENFISRYRGDELPCRPCLKGIPHGYGAAVTMRLDCDENVASARPLFELYCSRLRPISLAIVTGRLQSGEDIALISEVLQAGGSVLSHSETHSPQWGGSATAAEREARNSKACLEALFPDMSIRYAVSPFHQNPRYVPGALARAGYEGFICGSVASDPEFLMSRAGVPPFGPSDIVLHSQSCMLHGDCMLAGSEDPLSVFKEAFRLARISHEFFGYLDHPFSERYAYGWHSEKTRLDAHAAYLSHLEEQCNSEPLLFVNENSCMRFIKEKSEVLIEYDEETQGYAISRTEAAGFPLSISYRGEIHRAGS